ncbi:Mps1 [Kluyveromyces lactis]|nr:Mps1 [Kluyveromyces lactis]
MLGSDGVVRLNQSSFPTAESRHEYSRHQDAKTGLEEPTHSNPLHFVRNFNGRNTTHTSNHTEDQSQSTVFTMVNKQFQPSMTTMNTVVKENNDISNSNSNHENKYGKLNEESLMKDDTHSHTSQKFKVLQQNMKEELYNSTTKSSNKRNRRFITSRLSSLGPAKRNLTTSFNVDSPSESRIDNSQINSSIINDTSNISQQDIENSHTSNSSNTGYRYHDHNIFLETHRQHSTPNHDENKDPSANLQPNINYENIDFGDLNPYQYLKKYNLPSGELPYISKVYFERQKEENRKTVLRKATSGTLALKREFTQYRRTQTARQPRRKHNFGTDKTSLQDPLSSPLQKNQLVFQEVDRELANKREALKPLDVNNSSSSQEAKRPKYENDHVTEDYRPPFFSHRKAPSPHDSKPFKKVEIVEPPKSTVEVIPLKSEGCDVSSKLNKGDNYLNYNGSSDTKKRTAYAVPTITVNGTAYEKVELLGKGGSGKVYKVKSSDHKVYALKRVSFDEFDESSIDGFKGEIELLKKLENKQRVVKLIDYHMGQGVLFLLMECGEHDLSQVLTQRSKIPFDTEFVRYHFQEMIKCVKVVHDADIVHSDLKPANFVFVKGMLKIIDFGIANAVPDHTVNIYRDNQIGTPNYMAPETLVAMNFTRNDGEQAKWKVGKPSDVWSCGCILYQMVYGKPPYGTFQGNNRLYAIMNPDVKIPYPEKDSFGAVIPRTVIDTIRSCLERNPISRVTIDQLLTGALINPVTVTKFFIHDLIKNAVNYGCDQKHVNNDRVEELSEDVWNKLAEFKL